MTLDAPPDVRAMWFEDFRPGQRFATGSRTVTAEDLRAFTALSGDAHPVHVDAAGAAAAGFDQPILQGPFGLAAFFGLASLYALSEGNGDVLDLTLSFMVTALVALGITRICRAVFLKHNPSYRMKPMKAKRLRRWPWGRR